jgi:hypothetical protein
VSPALAQSEGRIEGVVYLDANGNGVRETGEQGLANVEVTFSSGGWSLQVTSGTDGTFGMDLNPATWVVTVKAPTGYAALVSSKEVIIANPGDVIRDVEFALVEGVEGAVLPESGGRIPENVMIGGLFGILAIGTALVVIGQRRARAV